jgi:small nuclear ribonucleoprotein G
MGILRGYDVYLNIVLDEALEEKAGGEKTRIGMVVIRGNSVVMLEVGVSVHVF